MWSARHRSTRWRARTSHMHACRSRGDSVGFACPRCAGFRRSSLGSRVSRHVDGAKAHRAPFACPALPALYVCVCVWTSLWCGAVGRTANNSTLPNYGAAPKARR